MRIWDRIPPQRLCRKHLLGEHRELHGLWNILVRVEVEGMNPAQVGYSRHPETLRWFGHRRALFNRHQALVTEMANRGYNHASPIPDPGTDGSSNRRPRPLDDQGVVLSEKQCECEPPG